MDTFFLSRRTHALHRRDDPSFFKSWLPAAVTGTQLPHAILVVSAHWETATPVVNVVRGINDTIYDFYGYPDSMYQPSRVAWTPIVCSVVTSHATHENVLKTSLRCKSQQPRSRAHKKRRFCSLLCSNHAQTRRETPPSAAVMDTFFLSHGGPTLCIDETIPAWSFFKSWLPAAVAGTQLPRAILVVSAHWETTTPAVNVVHGINDTIYDFYGYPDSMYQMKYPAPGAPELARRTKELLEQAGFGPVKDHHGRGLDHGAWVPLMLMYPKADIPVCQLSVQTDHDGTYHYNLGKALAPLRAEGILVLGSGSATHNLSKMTLDEGPVPQWASDFDTWLEDSLIGGRYDDVNRYDERAPYGKVAHPSPEHFHPLHVALGAAGDESKAELIHRSWGNTNHSYASYRFTAKN